MVALRAYSVDFENMNMIKKENYEFSANNQLHAAHRGPDDVKIHGFISLNAACLGLLEYYSTFRNIIKFTHPLFHA
ncbi:MAG: hypothetical protein Q8K53_00185 [Daejeonella sp.]|nr:hypothetical protein [Daejeonella sp.]